MDGMEYSVSKTMKIFRWYIKQAEWSFPVTAVIVGIIIITICEVLKG